MDVDPDRPDTEQMKLFAAMTPAQRYEVGRSLYWMAWKLKLAATRQAHPDWTDQEVFADVRVQFLRA